MFKKRFLYEQEEEVELNDFQKILALNKKRISRFDVEFETSDGKDFSNIIEVTSDGIIFTFDGLKEFLQFFFPDEYGGDYSDGEYEAINFESMYEGRWDWYDDFYNRTQDDWNEGYMVGSMTSVSLQKLKEILNYVAPQIGKYIEEKDGVYGIRGQEGEGKIADFLGTLGFEDEITDAYLDAQVASVSDSAPEYIQKTYCNCLTDIGIENYSGRHCFWKYEMDWGSAILLFARFGTENDKLLDLLFEAIKTSNVKHLPEYYEIQHYAYDNEAHNRVYVRELDRIFDKLEDKLESSEFQNEDYIELINKVSNIGGVGVWIKSKNNKFRIKIDNIDAETLKVEFGIVKNNSGSIKKGRSTIDDIINLLNNESMYGAEEFREHYLKFLQKTIL